MNILKIQTLQLIFNYSFDFQLFRLGYSDLDSIFSFFVTNLAENIYLSATYLYQLVEEGW